MASLFGTSAVHSRSSRTYDPWEVTDNEGKIWRFVYDSSIHGSHRIGRQQLAIGDSAYKVEMNSPKLEYREMPKLQEVVRALRHAGAVVNGSCGMHVHVDASKHTPQSLKNALSIMYSKEDIAMRVASLKKSKASPKSKIPFIRKRMTCPYCGDILQRNSKKSPRVYWDCKGCQNRFGPISDNELQQAVTEKLLAVCRNSQVVELDQQPTNSLSIQAARLTNEINQMLTQREVDTDRLLSLILECAAEKYKTCSIKESDHLTIKIKALFQEHSNDEKLDRELFEQTVKQVILQPDGSIRFHLLNGKTV